MSDSPPRGVVALLTAQGFAFGVTLALLVIPANSIFLDAYGSEWLPVTYIAIAVVGTGVSALIARAARRTRLVQVATATLGAFALLFAVSWPILVAGGVWVSAVLLVVFPIALQVGFVFIGGQAGRLLDIRQMKELFPRIVSGFAVGFLIGGLLGIPLLAVLGSTEHLLVATTVAQLTFLGLLLLTERRFPEVQVRSADDAPTIARPPLRMLFATGIALLLLGYQVLSAMGSWIFDFLLFDRASAHYSGDDLTKFLSAYTAVLNLIDILFLALLAGPLMRRFGLRLGLLLNPGVVAGILALMLVAAAGAGTAAFGVFVLAGILRIADIATTDGTTRTSINAAYQVVPVEERLAVQAVVEGIGVPLAIGATGVLLLALNVLGFGTGAVIAFGLVVSAIWTALALSAYRSYTQSLADEMRRRSLSSTELDVADDGAAAIRSLLRSDDSRDVRLGLDLLGGVASAVSDVDLRHVAVHADPEVRMRALSLLAARGDEQAAADAATHVRRLAHSDRARERRAAAAAFETRGVAGYTPELLGALLIDADLTVRAAALDAVAPSDAADLEIVSRVVSALDEPRLAGPASAAVQRLGQPVLPILSAALAAQHVPKRPALVRAAAAVAAEQGVDVVAPALADRDRTVVLTALEALEAGGGRVPPSALDDVFVDAAEHAERASAARAALADVDDSLVRALDDEIDLARRLVIATLALRYGDRVLEAVRVVDHAEGPRRALGVEALDVVLTRAEAAVALPLVRRDRELRAGERSARGPDTWIANIAHDPEGVWRSDWLATCAQHLLTSA